MKRICRNFIICSSTFLQEAFDKCDSGYFRGDNMVEPRVLVVSHNVFSSSGNMGKTMMHMLAGIPPDNLAQLYFHQEIPTRRCCLHYFIGGAEQNRHRLAGEGISVFQTAYIIHLFFAGHNVEIRQMENQGAFGVGAGICP